MKHNIELSQLEENINNKNSKLYFREIISSYYNGNYKAAITLLYAILSLNYMN